MIARYEPSEDLTAEVIFTCCLLCGKALGHFEKHDGVCQNCYESAEAEPMPFTVTDQGRAHAAVAMALEALHDEAADIQEGGTGRGFGEAHKRLSRTMEAFRELTGTDFFYND